MSIAALFVDPQGVYSQFHGIECWGLPDRDARDYDGSAPVIAHPPCARWSRLAGLVASRGGKAVGEDDGCFVSALASVRRCGGVLEHPASSSAWPAYGLTQPVWGTWHKSSCGGWVTEVAQVAYGHRARKLTWLYYVGDAPMALEWRRPMATARVSEAHGKSRPHAERMTRRERKATPAAFAAALIDLVTGSGSRFACQLSMF